MEQLGGLDIAVNNAGLNKNNAAEDTPEDEWDATFDLNTKGVFLCCQARADPVHPVLQGERPALHLLQWSICTCTFPKCTCTFPKCPTLVSPKEDKSWTEATH